jgi:hypothetical protein
MIAPTRRQGRHELVEFILSRSLRIDEVKNCGKNDKHEGSGKRRWRKTNLARVEIGFILRVLQHPCPAAITIGIASNAR